jgi:hypothetical protein
MPQSPVIPWQSVSPRPFPHLLPLATSLIFTITDLGEQEPLPQGVSILTSSLAGKAISWKSYGSVLDSSPARNTALASYSHTMLLARAPTGHRLTEQYIRKYQS